MSKGIIRFCYRKVIDASSQKPWDRCVFEDSYKEFLMQAQFYNQEKKFTSFAGLLTHFPAAERLHFLVSASITGYLQQLKKIIPDILNSLGKHFLHFDNYRFEIINSDIKDKNKHQVAINFFSESMIWHDTVGDRLLISAVNSEENKNGLLTDTVALQPFFSIYSLKNEDK